MSGLKQKKSPRGARIVGTLDQIPGIARISGFDETGEVGSPAND